MTERTGHMGYTFRFFGREMWMPWKASSVVEERLRFVARLLDGEAMTEVCRDFGISRNTGYKRSRSPGWDTGKGRAAPVIEAIMSYIQWLVAREQSLTLF